MKDSFIMYTDYMDALEDLTRAEAGDFLLICMEYAKTGKAPGIKNKAVRIAFKMAKQRMDRDAQKWEETIEKRKEAGKKGGQASASKRKQTLANVSKAKQSQANQAVYDSDSVDSTVIKNNGRTAPRFIKPSLEQIKEYCDQRRNGIDPQSFIDFYEARGWKLTKGVSMKDWKAAIRTWEKNRKMDPKARGKPPERDYNMDSLELKLLASN